MEPTFVRVSVGIDTFALEPNAAQRTLAKDNDQDTSSIVLEKQKNKNRERKDDAETKLKQTRRGAGMRGGTRSTVGSEEVRFLCVFSVRGGPSS